MLLLNAILFYGICSLINYTTIKIYQCYSPVSKNAHKESLKAGLILGPIGTLGTLTAICGGFSRK